MRLVIKGNGLKRKSQKNHKEVQTLDKTINVLDKKRKKLYKTKFQWTKLQ